VRAAKQNIVTPRHYCHASRQKKGVRMAEDENLQICIDRVIPDEYNPARATMERALEDYRSRTLDADEVARPELALPITKMWANGSEIKCRFLDGSPTQRSKVEAYAKKWEDYANITLKFVDSTDEQIRISFVADKGSWSALGTDALIDRYFPRYQPTMNYGWLRDDTDDTEYERVVVHEFGHALGCIHEHQSPKSKLKWNEAEVLRVFSGPPNNWTPAMIRHNILDKYSKTNMNASAFDKASIMLYKFPGSLFTNGVGTTANTTLSDGDKRFIARMYPK
jgi:hypothetical protein